ncbi:hypothetical protein GL267_004445 [Acidithiobacillus ferrianus]|uniref:Uncharacterized protein n=2 Tax=Acidithiobacillus ferrianus TaxID=2678518 RepID=A0A845UMP6_9PROT|nr:hypothetical protein [Acidithiobacillus ferrianus]NDU42868.1 hypothetical protein [Acidithiobacillus ferrianus]
MSVTDDVKQAVQSFLVPELNAIKAQIAEVRGVQTQMSERLSEQAAQILAQRHETAESMARMETRLESRMDRIESRLDRQNDKLDQILMMLAPHTKAAGG